jgi:hypothetical protein
MSSWITEKLKEKANIQKQSRLFKEEFSKKTGKGVDDDDKSKTWKKQKGKGGKSSGGADGSAAT